MEFHWVLTVGSCSSVSWLRENKIFRSVLNGVLNLIDLFDDGDLRSY